MNGALRHEVEERRAWVIGASRAGIGAVPALHGALTERVGCVIDATTMRATFASPRNSAGGSPKAAAVQGSGSLVIARATDGPRADAVAPGFVAIDHSVRTLLGRWSRPCDAADAVPFPASDAAACTTGPCSSVDGVCSIV